MPKPGVSVLFVDPKLTALEANVFWINSEYRGIISAYTRKQDDRGFGGIISLAEIQCRKTLLKSVDGDQHLLLVDGRRAAQVRCLGQDIRVSPFAIEPVIDGFPNIESRQRLIRLLADLYRNRSFRDTKGWTVEGMRHRDALAALDRRIQGHSYREIALFLYGEMAVETDWRNPDQTMKNRVIRSVKRGIRLRDGEYRKLLG